MNLNLHKYTHRTELFFPSKEPFYNTYNASFIPYNDGYLFTARSCHHKDLNYPTHHSDIVMFTVTKEEMNETKITIENGDKLVNVSDSQKHISYTSGLEDPRIWSSTYLTAVGLETNDRWQPEVVLCKFNIEDKTLTQVKSLLIHGDNFIPQKNWLILKEEDQTMDMLYSINPFRIVRLNKDTGRGFHEIIKTYETIEKHGSIHCGACMYLEDKAIYLVICRVVFQHQYQYSLWIQLDTSYQVIGVSKPFAFDVRENYNGILHYETCMSIVRKNSEEIYASVTYGDQHVYIYTMLLKDIEAEIESI